MRGRGDGGTCVPERVAQTGAAAAKPWAANTLPWLEAQSSAGHTQHAQLAHCGPALQAAPPTLLRQLRQHVLQIFGSTKLPIDGIQVDGPVPSALDSSTLGGTSGKIGQRWLGAIRADS
jgi:hypothetical protein